MSEVGVAGLPVTLFAVGLVVSGVVGYLTIKYFLRYLANHSLAVFAYYRFALAAVTVGLARDAVIHVVASAEFHHRVFRHGAADHQRRGAGVDFPGRRRGDRAVSVRLLGRAVPGLGVLITAAIILVVGAVANNVFGKRVLQRAEYYLLQVPVFKTIYAPVRQLVAAFSPDNEAGFKKVVIVEDPRRGMLLGFLTKEFTLDRGRGAEAVVAVYVPTNHLYLGDVFVYPREQASVSGPDRRGRHPDLSHRRHGAAEPASQRADCQHEQTHLSTPMTTSMTRMDIGQADSTRVPFAGDGASAGARPRIGRGAAGARAAPADGAQAAGHTAGRRGQHPPARSQSGRLPRHDRPSDPAVGSGGLRAGSALRRVDLHRRQEDARAPARWPTSRS